MRLRDTLLIFGVSLVALLGAFFVNFQSTPAMAQGNSASGGVIAFPVQYSAQLEAVCLIDTQNKTICIYEVSTRGKTSNLTLKAARDYTFDIQIHAYATSPSPEEIKKEVEKDRKRREALKDAG